MKVPVEETRFMSFGCISQRWVLVNMLRTAKDGLETAAKMEKNEKRGG